MLLAHEYQHNETMLQLLQMVDESSHQSTQRRRRSQLQTAPRWSRWLGGRR